MTGASGGVSRMTLIGALVVSLALNAFFIGLWVTDALQARETGLRPRALSVELRWMDDRLPAVAVAEVEAALAAARPEVEERLGRVRDIRGEVDALLAAPSPDRAALDEKLTALRQELEAVQDRVSETTYDAVVALPAEARAGLATPRRR
jgi:uncharacterized membrane protein